MWQNPAKATFDAKNAAERHFANAANTKTAANCKILNMAEACGEQGGAG